jgi:hypothetical protein
VTIRRLEDWGVPGEIPVDVPSATSDADAARALIESGVCLLEGGDLWRTLGGSSDSDGRRGTRFTIDLLEVTIDDRSRSDAVSSVVVRRPWWTGGWWFGRVVFVMNAEFFGRHDVAPRGHPNDGRFELVEIDASMSRRERWQARRRALDGTHVPHPSITVTSSKVVRTGPGVLLVDGRRRGRVRSVEVTIRPDAAEVWIRRPD